MVKHPKETIEQTWPRRSRSGRAETPVPGLLMVFSAKPVLKPIRILAEPLVLGRGAVLGGIEIDDPHMSRTHAEIALDGTRWTVRDLGSRNGTFVDGEPLPTNGQVTSESARVVRVGDTIVLLCRDLVPYHRAIVEERDGVILGPTLAAVWREIAQAAPSSEVLHLTGETGSGKELAALHFHRSGPHPDGPFVAVNCATIQPSLAERLLFGAKRGAYSGADADSEGWVQAADGGTLFLDEVGELELTVQAKLLRVVETREVMPLGATKSRKIKVRFCSATHLPLRARVASGGFREDLYFRLARPSVALPPLRDRSEELAYLIDHALAGRTPRGAAHVSLVEAALLRPWPGNVRELLLEVEDAARRAAAAGSPEVEAHHLSETAGVALYPATDPRGAPSVAGDADEEPDRAALEAALAQAGGNVARAARELGVHRTQLRRWLAKHQLKPTKDD